MLYFRNEDVTELETRINKLMSVFHASVLLLIMNFVIALSKQQTTLTML